MTTKEIYGKKGDVIGDLIRENPTLEINGHKAEVMMLGQTKANVQIRVTKVLGPDEGVLAKPIVVDILKKHFDTLLLTDDWKNWYPRPNVVPSQIAHIIYTRGIFPDYNKNVLFTETVPAESHSRERGMSDPETPSKRRPLGSRMDLIADDEDLFIKTLVGVQRALKKGHQLMQIASVEKDARGNIRTIGEVLQLLEDGSIAPAERFEFVQKAEKALADEGITEEERRERLIAVVREIFKKRAALIKKRAEDEPIRAAEHGSIRVQGRRSRLRSLLRKRP